MWSWGKTMKTIYGPVPSWRFGRSLGVDPVCRVEKICSFDCIYCQLGKTRSKTMERKEYVGCARVCRELEAADKSTSDVITFSGTSEPTLNLKIGEMIGFAKKFGLPVVVLTNSSLLHLREVREALGKADIVSAKLDAPNEKLFREINKPLEGIHFETILGGLKKFRKEFGGKFALQMMFVEANKGAAGEMAKLACELEPDEVQLDTPLRPSPVPPLSIEEMERIEGLFRGLPTISVYKKKKPNVVPLDIHETAARRPEE
jgi:wyosine [tRNA(Phe)-imidazoG37] synthetase (radical SAM superfamily)